MVSREPLPKPGNMLINTRFLYDKALLPSLPISILMVIFYHFAKFGHYYLPEELQQITLAQMCSYSFMVILAGSLLFLMEKIAKLEVIDYTKLALLNAERLASYIGVLLSIIFLPGLIGGIGLSLYFYLLFINAPIWLNYIIALITISVMLLAFLPNIFAPILVIQNSVDEALNLSQSLIKIHFLSSMAYFLFAIISLSLLFSLTHWTSLVFTNHLTRIMFEGISEMLLILYFPFIASLWVVQKNICQKHLQIMMKSRSKSF